MLRGLEPTDRAVCAISIFCFDGAYYNRFVLWKSKRGQLPDTSYARNRIVGNSLLPYGRSHPEQDASENVSQQGLQPDIYSRLTKSISKTLAVALASESEYRLLISGIRVRQQTYQELDHLVFHYSHQLSQDCTNTRPSPDQAAPLAKGPQIELKLCVGSMDIEESDLPTSTKLGP